MNYAEISDRTIAETGLRIATAHLKQKKSTTLGGHNIAKETALMPAYLPTPNTSSSSSSTAFMPAYLPTPNTSSSSSSTATLPYHPSDTHQATTDPTMKPITIQKSTSNTDDHSEKKITTCTSASTNSLQIKSYYKN